jgi:hypothetical protein
VHQALGSIRLGFMPGRHQLRLIIMHFGHGNESSYWMGRIRVNPQFSSDKFSPKGRP